MESEDEASEFDIKVPGKPERTEWILEGGVIGNIYLFTDMRVMKVQQQNSCFSSFLLERFASMSFMIKWLVSICI